MTFFLVGKATWESSSKTNVISILVLIVNIVAINFMSPYFTGGKTDMIYMVLICVLIILEQKIAFKSVPVKGMIFWGTVLVFHMVCTFYFFFFLLNSMSLNGYIGIDGKELITMNIGVTFIVLGTVCIIWKYYYIYRFEAVQKIKIFNEAFLGFTMILILLNLYNFIVIEEIDNLQIVTLSILSVSTLLFLLYYNIFAFSLKFAEMGQNKDKVGALSKELEALVEEEVLLEKSIRIDGLTGVYTKEYIMRTLDSICNDFDKPFVVFFADLNKLKAINDTYGHTVGDEYLKAGAEIIKSNFREVDYVGRIGGDELLVICNDLDERVAEIIIERIRTNLFQRSAIEKIELSASIGFVKVTREMADRGSLFVLELADKAMRNQKAKYYEREGEKK